MPSLVPAVIEDLLYTRAALGFGVKPFLSFVSELGRGVNCAGGLGTSTTPGETGFFYVTKSTRLICVFPLLALHS